MNNYICTNGGCERPCVSPQSCGPQQPCQSCPEPQPMQNCCCPCSDDFRRALDVICCPQLQGLIDTASFSFITPNYILGTSLSPAPAGTAPADNLTDPAATYVCGGAGCESLTVSGTLYPTTVESAALATVVTQVVLCRLIAISFDASDTGEGADTNFQAISRFLGNLLRPQRPQECTGIADALTSAAAVRASTLTAGPLVVQNSTILGKVGSVLVVANSTDARFYLICADKIDFMG